MTPEEIAARLTREANRSWRSNNMRFLLRVAAAEIEVTEAHRQRRAALWRDMERRLPSPWRLHTLEHGVDGHGRWRWACICRCHDTLSRMGIGDTPEQALADVARREGITLGAAVRAIVEKEQSRG